MSIFPTKILLATDGSEEAVLAAQTAADLANKTDSELHIVHVRARITPHYPGYYVGPEMVEDAEEKERKHLDREAQRLLDTQVEQVGAAGGSVAQLHLRVGRPDEEIVALAEELEARLIVLGSRGHGGVRRALMGSVSDSVVRHAHCPVMVVRWKSVVFPAKILLATDGSKGAELADFAAADLAKGTGSELHVVTVAPEYPYVYAYYDVRHPAEVERHRQEAQEILDHQVDRLLEAGGSVAKAHLKMGVADEEIVVLAKDLEADLIVMGTRGLGRLRRALMGSVSDSVVRHAHCPVMVVREVGSEVRE